MNLLSCTCSVSSRLHGLLKAEVACVSCLIALTGLSSINLSQIPPSYLYFQLLQHPVAMCSTMSLSVVWKSCFHLAWVQQLYSRANRCLLSKASLCCILFYNEGISCFLHMKSATSLSKRSTENAFALNRDSPPMTNLCAPSSNNFQNCLLWYTGVSTLFKLALQSQFFTNCAF